MKRTIRFLIGTLFVLSTLLAAAACGKAPAAPQKLTIWINGRDSWIGPSEQQLPQDQWYISQAIKRFEAANPGVTVEMVVQPDAGKAHELFRTAALAGNAPDVANLWAGTFIFALKDAITPITDKIPQADRDQIMGWNTDTLDFKEGNPILGYPTPDDQLCFFIYNKQIIQKVGLDFEANPPRTMDDFYADMEKIKNAGYIPFAVDETADGYPYYFFQVAAYWWVQQNGIDPILAEDRGEAKFADDQALLAALDTYHEIWAKGYMNQDAATSSDSWSKFLQGKVAMVPRVSTFLKDAQDAMGAENIGVILPPEISDTAKIKNGTIGGPGQVLVVSKNSKNVDLAIKFMSFLDSKSEVLELAKFQIKVPIRKDVSGADLGAAPGSVLAKLLEWSGHYVFWVDNSLSGPVVNDFIALVPTVMTGKMTPLAFAQQLDKDKGSQ
jgi:raffinose/stachyose/melibiose transport system substrate-binding protein